MVMAITPVSATGSKPGYTQLSTTMANIVAQNTNTLASGSKINASRGGAATLAGQAQALANQTGGNIMGFTYE